MKVVIVGFGTQGKKRLNISSKDVVGIVDPNNPSVRYNKLKEVSLEIYDSVLICVPDNQKIDLIKFCIKNKKNILVEKPLNINQKLLLKIQKEANKNKIVIYTAYNHRFEPHLIEVKKILDKKLIGKIYYAKIFYGNGTAKLVKRSPWRDQGSGIIDDLGSHLLDLYLFFFKSKKITFTNISSSNYENKSYDHSIILGKNEKKFQILLEMSMCSWKNEFFLDIYGSKGSIHVQNLCKWGPSTLSLRKRVIPSGKPKVTSKVLNIKDPTWKKEYTYFSKLIKESKGTNLEKDIWISNNLNLIKK